MTLNDDVNGETEQAPADDLRSSLATAYAEQETRQQDTRAAPEASTEAAADPVVDAAGEGEADTGPDGQTAAERARDAAGKFVKGDGKPVKAAADKAPAKDPAKAAVDPAAVDPAAASLATGPAALEKWTPAQKEMFKRQPPEVQEFILGRHKALEADYFKKTREFAGFRKDYEPVEQIFAPHREVMRQKGLTPRSLIEAWTNVETRLTRGEGVDVIKGLIQGYNIDRNQLIAALGISNPRQAQDPARQDERGGDDQQQLPYTIDKNGEPIALPPMVLDKLRKLDSLEERLNQVDQFNRNIVNEGRSAQERRMMNHIDSFKSATDESGNLKHPHFDEIEDDMATIANGMLARGQSVPPLDELYERAVYANPSTRQSLRAAERQEAETKRQDEARAKAAAARKAGASQPGGYPSGGQAPSSTHKADRPLREELEHSYANVTAA